MLLGSDEEPDSTPKHAVSNKYYEYEKLHSAEIRVLELKPGGIEDAIQCSLKPVRVDAAINTYEAISYAWGDISDTRWITCSDRSIRVTKCLWDALKYLRYEDRSRYLWADALCINQSDIPERNSQVQSMGEVYSNAARVLIWLGVDTLDVAGALRNLPSWLQYPKPHIEWDKAQVKWISQSSFTFESDGLSEEATEWLRYQQKAFIQNIRLFSLPWWRRKWVIQELVRAKEAVLICGYESVNWSSLQDDFTEFTTPFIIAKLTKSYIEDLHWSETDGSVGDLALQGFQNALRLADCVAENSKGLTGQGPGLKLIQLLNFCRDFKCSDARDHLYSMLAIANDIDRDYDSLLAVDYMASVATVNIRLSAYFLHTGHSDPLNHFQSATGIRQQFLSREQIAKDSVDMMPSWACNYLDPPLKRPDLERTLGWLKFDAGGISRELSIAWKVSLDGRVLSIKGYVIGEIAKVQVQAPWHSRRAYAWTEDELMPWAGSVWQVVSNGYKNLEPLELFYELVTCGGEKSNSDRNGWTHPTPESAQSWLDFFLHQKADGSDKPSMGSEAYKIYRCMQFALSRKLCIMSTGHIGWIPQIAEVGDKICVFPGSRYLSVISACGEGHYNLIGFCYMQELMWGEALDLGLKEEWIHLY